MSTTAKSDKDCTLQKVLDLACGTAKSELGTTPTNKRVTATATLATKVVENGTCQCNGVDASVSLGVSSSSKAVEPECCCSKTGDKSGCCCARKAESKPEDSK